MNAAQLEHQIAGAVNFALASKETHPSEAIAILESIKIELYLSVRAVAQKQKTQGIVVVKNLPDSLK